MSDDNRNHPHRGRAAVLPAALMLGAGLAAALAAPVAAQGLQPSDAAQALATLAASAPSTGAPAPATAPAAAPGPVAFTLRSVAFTGTSGYFTTTELDRIVAPWIGRRLDMATVAALAEAIDMAYRARGADLAQARVVAVDPGAGRVTLDLFEARLGAVTYRSQRAAPAYLAMRSGLAPGDLADTRRIAERLERLALTDGVLADAAFSPGAAPGTTDLAIALAEPPATSTELRLDNYGEVGSGELRALMSFQINNLTGWNDPLALDVTLSQGARALGLSYGRTISPGGATIGLNTSYQTTDSVTGPARHSLSMSAGASFAVPLALSLERQIWLSASAEIFDESATTLGLTTADQAGVSASLSLAGVHDWADAPITRAAWNVTATAGRYDDAVLGLAGQSFAILAASAQIEAPLGEWGRLVALGAGQYAPGGTLPSRYGFAVTSPFAVAGYDIGLSQGAAGYWGRLQIESARPLPLGGKIDLRPYAFAALGEAFDHAGGVWVGQGRATAAGVGLSGQTGAISFDAQLARSFTNVLGVAPGWSLRAGISARF